MRTLMPKPAETPQLANKKDPFFYGTDKRLNLSRGTVAIFRIHLVILACLAFVLR